MDQDEVFHWRGRRVHCRRAGSGPDVVFCHGTPWSSGLLAPRGARHRLHRAPVGHAGLRCLVQGRRPSRVARCAERPARRSPAALGLEESARRQPRLRWRRGPACPPPSRRRLCVPCAGRRGGPRALGVRNSSAWFTTMRMYSLFCPRPCTKVPIASSPRFPARGYAWFRGPVTSFSWTSPSSWRPRSTGGSPSTPGKRPRWPTGGRVTEIPK
jgi:hypothetical protein